MYTRCPQCRSVFRVTAVLLQMADGDVRCGNCSEVFNALHTLVDEWTGTADASPAPEPAQPRQAESAVPDFEFNVPEDEWQKFFIADGEVTAARDDPALGDEFIESPDEPQKPLRSLDAETADTNTWKMFLAEAAAEPEPEEPPAADESAEAGDATRQMPAVEDAAAVEPEPVEPEIPAVESAPADPPAPTGRFAEKPSPAPPDTVLDWGPSFRDNEPSAQRHTGRWLAAGLAAALVLGGQVVHHYRDRLAADPAWGGAVRDVYRRVELPLYPEWPIDAFEIRDMKAIAENSAPGSLDIVAEIAVTGGQAVGLPMLRVVLRDRWSNAVASGTYAAADYLAEATRPGTVYPPGSLIPVQLVLKDPGAAAQGYELDICMPDRQRGLLCRNARDSFRR
ncbi:MAG: DUF3426 domain-containing protein [Gammaproteobacteria bacterium]|nr:DUF3426 domain-containing protein [Gammaproteobacteria bacterium]